MNVHKISMDDREHKHKFQSLGICNKLFNFMKFLPTQVLKILTSGRLTPHGLSQAPGLNNSRIEASSSSTSTSQAVLPVGQGKPPQEAANMEAKTKIDHVPSRTSSNEQDEVGDNHATQEVEDNGVGNTQLQEEETPFPSDAPPNKAPKKMVSINENVETINLSKKKRKRKKLQEDDQPAPLKPILKVGSDVNNTAEPVRLLSRANGA